MTKTSALTATLLLGCWIAPAFGQDGCPALPKGTDLQWQKTDGAGLTICKAVGADGNRVFGVMLTSEKPNLDTSRRNRAEEASIDGQEVRWYRTEIANQPNAQDRVTVLKLGPDRYAQIWVDAPDESVVAQRLAIAQQLSFGSGAAVASSP